MGIIKSIANEAFPDAGISPYTSNELKRTKRALEALGYFYSPAGAYPDDEKLKYVVHDYLKTDDAGKVTGIVTLHLAQDDKDRDLVEDGIVTIAHDDELMERVGSTTTVSEFASKMNPNIVQKAVTLVFPSLKEG